MKHVIKNVLVDYINEQTTNNECFDNINVKKIELSFDDIFFSITKINSMVKKINRLNKEFKDKSKLTLNHKAYLTEIKNRIADELQKVRKNVKFLNTQKYYDKWKPKEKRDKCYEALSILIYDYEFKRVNGDTSHKMENLLLKELKNINLFFQNTEKIKNIVNDIIKMIKNKI